MGSYLSFPLLCLHNYIMFRSEFGRSTPVRINGDDIVFRARPERIDRWASLVKLAGLRLSLGKTLRHPRVFSLNSTFFSSSRRGTRLLPVIRSSTLWSTEERVGPDPGALRRFRSGVTGDARDRFASFFLRERRSEILALGRSVTRGLGFRVPARVLSSAGLYDRERSYMALGFKERQVPCYRGQQGWIAVPAGWRRIEGKMSCHRRADLKHLFFEMVEEAWRGKRFSGESTSQWWARAKATSIRPVSVRGGRSYAHKWVSPTGTYKFSVRCRLMLNAGFSMNEWRAFLKRGSLESWIHDSPSPPRLVWARSGRAPSFLPGASI